jgi:hypothetical protein
MNPRWQVEIQESDGVRRTTYRSPGGQELVHEYAYDAPSDSWHPTRYLCAEIEDVELLTDYFSGVEVVPLPADERAALEAQAAQGRQSAIVQTGAGESPLMEWIEHVAGIEAGHYLLVDETEAVEALFAAMHRVLCDGLALLCQSGIYDVVVMVENTSTTLISTEQYARYCFGHISDYARIAREAGCRLQLHMCGHLKALLPQLAQLPVNSFEAFTAPPVGNTRLIDGRRACPDTCLIGGTSASLWMRSQEEIIAAVLRDLDELPHHRGIVLSSAGVMPPICPPAVAKAVSEAVGAISPRG